MNSNNIKNKNLNHAMQVLIEDASSGRQLIQEFKNQMPIVPILPRTTKIDRFQSVVFLFENQKCKLPKYDGIYFNILKFMEEFEDEVLSFPDSKYSDIVDSVSQFLNYQFNSERKNVESTKDRPIFVS